MIEPRFRWSLPPADPPGAELIAAGAGLGLGPRAVALLAGRGLTSTDDLDRFVAPPLQALHDPRLLPDAGPLLDRIARARASGERVLVFGDFDADGLTGLAILVLALGRLGLDVVPYVPSRLDEGHGLSAAGLDAAVAAGATLIVTVDTGSSSGAEIELARSRGIDVVVTDHHRVPSPPPRPVALVNPHRPDSAYPDRRLAGSGVAFKVAQLLLTMQDDRWGPGPPAVGLWGNGPGDWSAAPAEAGSAAALDLADLATIGTVSDLAPVVGENRAIARLGLERMRSAPRPGIAALLARAGVAPAHVDLETVGFAIAPRLNAAGRVGEAMDAARLLLAPDRTIADGLAATLDAANVARRDLTKQVLAEARAAADVDSPLVLARGPWPVGVVGLVAARLAEDTGRPAIVGADLEGTVRASCRSGPGVDLAALLERVADLLIRHGGHAGAAGFEVTAERWPELAGRLRAELEAVGPPDPRPGLVVDLRLPAREVDYGLVAELDRLAPYGPGHADPLVLIDGLTVARVRTANGGHTQLVLRRRPDVLDGIAFGRDDLAASLAEGDPVEVVARVASRSFGGVESLQLEVRDIGPAGWADGLAASPPIGTDVTTAVLQASGT